MQYTNDENGHVPCKICSKALNKYIAESVHIYQTLCIYYVCTKKDV